VRSSGCCHKPPLFCARVCRACTLPHELRRRKAVTGQVLRRSRFLRILPATGFAPHNPSTAPNVSLRVYAPSCRALGHTLSSFFAAFVFYPTCLASAAPRFAASSSFPARDRDQTYHSPTTSRRHGAERAVAVGGNLHGAQECRQEKGLR
jgi:hypothetical protein